MTDSLFVRCANCYLKHRRLARVVCLCGMVIGGPLAYSIFNDGDVRNTQAPVAAYTATATGTNTSLDTTVMIASPLTYQVREVPGPGFNSMMKVVPSEQLPVHRGYKGVGRYVAPTTVTDVSSGTSLKPPNPRST